MSSMALFATTRSRCDGLTWLFLLVRVHDSGVSYDCTLETGIHAPRLQTMLTAASPQTARSTHAKELTLISPPPILAQPIVAPHYRTLACTPDLSSPENDICPKNLFPSVACSNLVLHYILTLANMFPLVALPTQPQTALGTSLRTRRSGGDRRRQKHSRERKRQQRAVNRIHHLEGGDNRSRRTPSPLRLDRAPNDNHRRKPHHQQRHMRCPRIP